MITVGRVLLIASLFVVAMQDVTRTQTIAHVPAPLPAMPVDADPAFEVATIKPTDSSVPHGSFIRQNGNHVVAYNMSIEELIIYAYGIHAKQLARASGPLFTTHFDIDGVPDVNGHPNRNQTRLMFQKLLASRFKLTFHYELRRLSVYTIQVAKGGPKLAVTTRRPGDGTSFSYVCPPVLTVRNYSMTDFARGIQDGFLDKPVVDETGLTDRYDFDLTWSPDESQTYCPNTSPDSAEAANAPPSIYTAFQEQLGLKLTSAKAPVQVMVIDHIMRPSEN